MGNTQLDSGALYRQAFIGDRVLRPTRVWRLVRPEDAQRIECDRGHMCGQHARWATRNGPPFSYVCDFHRCVFDSTGTFWKDETK